MNAAHTRFGSLFMDLLDSLTNAFPECKQTAKIRKLLQLNPSDMDSVKLDWARMIVPYNMRAYRCRVTIEIDPATGRKVERLHEPINKKHPMDYFVRIYNEVGRTHMFHQLALCQKYEAFEDDLGAKDTLCGYLADLETYALDEGDTLEAIIEEPTTPGSDIDMKIPQSTSPTSSRFDDAELTRMCIEKLGDPDMITQAQSIVRGIPELSKIYGDRSNEEIANQMKAMQPMLPQLMQIINVLPIQHIIKMVEKTVPDPNKQKHVSKK